VKIESNAFEEHPMKRPLLSAIALTLAAGVAAAADLPSRKAEPLLPPPMWTGFYVGLNAGGTWANSNSQTVAVAPVTQGFLASEDVAAFAAAGSVTGSNSGSNGGFIGGGQIGYNWKIYNSFVAGVEADIQGLTGNSRGHTFITAVPTPSFGNNWVGITSARGNLDYIGTVRGRLGWLFTPTLLVYGTGGLAYGGATLNTASTVYNDGWNLAPISAGGVNFSNLQVGWTAGGGVEWMFMPNWSAKAEYLYYDLGTVTQNFAMPVVANTGATALFGGQVRARVNGNIVRAGLNYHFNWSAPAPVVAKY
jgi:outer membrane immunogenic protein